MTYMSPVEASTSMAIIRTLCPMLGPHGQAGAAHGPGPRFWSLKANKTPSRGQMAGTPDNGKNIRIPSADDMM